MYDAVRPASRVEKLEKKLGERATCSLLTSSRIGGGRAAGSPREATFRRRRTASSTGCSANSRCPCRSRRSTSTTSSRSNSNNLPLPPRRPSTRSRRGLSRSTGRSARPLIQRGRGPTGPNVVSSSVQRGRVDVGQLDGGPGPARDQHQCQRRRRPRLRVRSQSACPRRRTAPSRAFGKHRNQRHGHGTPHGVRTHPIAASVAIDEFDQVFPPRPT